MGKTINVEKLSETITLTEQTDGWWLYDNTRGMNIGMREESRDKAFLKAICYYQKRLSEVEQKHKQLSKRVESFIGQFIEDYDIDC